MFHGFGGRLFYIGEVLRQIRYRRCPRNVLQPLVFPLTWLLVSLRVAIIAIRKAAEYAEDDEEQAWKDLEQYDTNELDKAVGIALGPLLRITGLRTARNNGVLTGSGFCNMSETNSYKFPNSYRRSRICNR